MTDEDAKALCDEARKILGLTDEEAREWGMSDAEHDNPRRYNLLDPDIHNIQDYSYPLVEKLRELSEDKIIEYAQWMKKLCGPGDAREIDNCIRWIRERKK